VRVREALRQARGRLEPVSDSPALDARVLLADTLDTSPGWLLAHDDETISTEAEEVFLERLRRRAGGEPLPYVLGWWEFHGRRFAVSSSVLIPRPETELLLDLALTDLRRRRLPTRLIDVGTGSGCVAVSLAVEAPPITVVAADVSRPALEVARANARAHQVGARLQLVQASLLQGMAGGWDLICANLPPRAAGGARRRAARHGTYEATRPVPGRSARPGRTRAARNRRRSDGRVDRGGAGFDP